MAILLRTIRHPDRPSDVHPLIAKKIEVAVVGTPPAFRSGAHGPGSIVSAALTVHAYISPVDQTERWAIVLTGTRHANIIKDSPAKRHVLAVYREIAWLAENTHQPTAAAPHAWDYTDIPELPTNLGGNV